MSHVDLKKSENHTSLSLILPWMLQVDFLRKSNVLCQYLFFNLYVACLMFSVEYKKRSCYPVEFKGQCDYP